MKYIGILLAVMSLTELQAQNDSVKIRSYGIANEYFINYLGFVKPNIAIVPCKGGVYVPNWKVWYLKTHDSILSVEPSYMDNTLLITRTSKKYFEVIKVSNDTLRKELTPLVMTRGYVFYAVPSNYVKGLNFFVVGCHNTFNICRLYDGKVDTIFHCDKMIVQLEVINRSSILFCYDNKLVIYPLAGKPSVLFDAGKYKIHGFTSDEQGGVFISTDAGIIKIDPKKQQSVFQANHIKGKLRYSNNELYILDAVNSKLFVMPLVSAKFIQLASASIAGNEHPVAARVSDTLTNDDIIKMVNAKLSDEIIIESINASEVNFNVSVDDMIMLSDKNVSSAVIMAMKNAMKRKKQ